MQRFKDQEIVNVIPSEVSLTYDDKHLQKYSVRFNPSLSNFALLLQLHSTDLHPHKTLNTTPRNRNSAISSLRCPYPPLHQRFRLISCKTPKHAVRRSPVSLLEIFQAKLDWLWLQCLKGSSLAQPASPMYTQQRCPDSPIEDKIEVRCLKYGTRTETTG